MTQLDLRLTGRPFVELCCGAAAVSLWAMGKVRPPCGYMGSKRRYAQSILAELGDPVPSEVILNDMGLWALAYKQFFNSPWVVLQHLEGMEGQGRTLFSMLVEGSPSRDPEERAAQFIALQGACVGSKPVTIRDGRWKTSGYASLSPLAVEKGFTDRLIPANAGKRLRRLLPLMTWPKEFWCLPAQQVEPIPGAIVYIDPPYRNTTGYGHTLSREEVVAVARRWAEAGCIVAISESEPIEELGWRSVPVLPNGQHWQAGNFAKGHKEWLTTNAAEVRAGAG